MNGAHISTNWKSRDLVCLADLPKKAARDFDYIDADEHYSPRLIKYRGAWYDTHDTQRIEPDTGRAHPMGWAMRVHPGSPLAHFDCILSDSYFSAVLFRFTNDGESVICATLIS